MCARALTRLALVALALGFASGNLSVAAPPMVSVDRYDDPLPAGALARFGTIRFRHDGCIKGLIFHPDGKALITWSDWDKTIRSWDVTNGKEMKKINGATKVAPGLSKQPLFACAEEEGVIRIFDSTGTELRQLEAGTDAPRLKLVFAADGSTLASVHDVYLREEFRSYPLINLWDAATARFLRQIEAKDSSDHASVVLSPDGSDLVIGGANGRIHLYEVKTGKLRHELKADATVYNLAITADGKMLASSGYRKVVQLWDIRTGKESGKLDIAAGDAGPLAFSPDGIQLVVGTDAGIQVWDVPAKKVMHQLPRSSRWSDSFAISPDGKTLASRDWIVRLWDLRSGKELLPFDEPSRPAECLAFSPDGQYVAAGDVDHDSSIRIWNLKSRTQTHVIQKQTRTIHALEFTPDGRNLISASADQSIYWWDVESARHVRSLHADDQVTSSALSADGSLLVHNGGGQEVLLCDGVTGKPLPGLPVGDLFIHRVAFGLGKRLLITTEYQTSTVRLWRLAERSRSCSLENDRERWSNPEIAVSPDGKALATTEKNGTVRLWELATGKERLRINLEGVKDVSGIAFAAHGQVLAISGGGMIYFCDVGTGKEVSRLKAPAEQEHLIFSSDGKKLASASRDTTILLWDVSQVDGERPSPRRLDKRELEQLQTDLEAEDARKAYLTINTLAAAPEQAVTLVKNLLRPAVPVSEKEVAALIADLDSEEFAIREAAARKLEAMEEVGEPWLRKALVAKPSPEVRRRAEAILSTGNPHPVTARERTALRGVELLERVATQDAVLHLQALSKGSPDARITLDAQGALERIRRRPVR
jgi:WD40 repeat protein